MNRQLRKRHTGFALGLLVCVPLGYCAALLGRPSESLTQAADLGGEVRDESATSAVEASIEGIQELGYELSIRRSVGTQDSFIELSPSTQGMTPAPDILVYFLSSELAPPAGSELPAEARLLGSLRGDRPELLALPPSASENGGQIILYSLAHAELLASASFNAWEH